MSAQKWPLELFKNKDQVEASRKDQFFSYEIPINDDEEDQITIEKKFTMLN